MTEPTTPTMTDSQREIFTVVTGIVEEIAGIPAAGLVPEQSLMEDLDIDSLTMIEIALAVQDRFDVDVPDDDLKSLQNLGDVVRLVEGATSSAREPA